MDSAPTTEDAEPPVDDTGVAYKDPAPAEGVSISEIAALQTLKITLAKDGSPASSSVPLVAGKEAVLRVYIKLAPEFVTHNIVAVLDLTAGGQTKQMKDVLAPAVSSSEDAMLSTFNFLLTPELVTSDATFSVRLLEQTKTKAPTTEPLPTQYPMDGTAAPLKAIGVGGQMKLVLVPMKYTYDGSGRMPDTSQAQIDLYRDLFYSMFPAPKITVTVRAAINVPGQLTRTGTGWSSALQALANARQADSAPADAYYYGIFAPAASFQAFCQSGCIAGLSMLAQSPNDSWARAGIGVGFGGNDGDNSAFVALHEIGHQHGRNHAPCGNAQGVDPSYPHAQGATNTVGYALTNIGWAGKGTVLTPKYGNYTVRDIMSYCEPKWISDYTYKALFDRMKIVNGATLEAGPVRSYRWAVLEDGHLTNVGRRISGNLPPHGEPRVIDGKSGWFYPFDHVTGGMFLLAD